jgi:hypothetical protein
MLEDKSDANTERHQRLIPWDELAGQLACQGRFQESAAAIERLFAGGGRFTWLPGPSKADGTLPASPDQAARR